MRTRLHVLPRTSSAGRNGTAAARPARRGIHPTGLVAAAAVATGFGLFVLARSSNAPQRMFEFRGRTSLIGIQNGYAYLQEWQRRPVRITLIREVPLNRKAPSREVTRGPGEPGTFINPRITNAGLIYLTELGDPASDQGEANLSRPPRQFARYGLRRTPLTGGPPLVVTNQAQGSPVVSATRCYWIRSSGPSPERPSKVRRMAELVSCSLTGGPIEWVARVPEPVVLAPSPTGIYWIVSDSLPGKPKDLVYHSPAEARFSLLPDFTGSTEPVELDGRVYWIEDTGAGHPPGEAGSSNSRIYSVGLDGSERRLSFDLRSLPGTRGVLGTLASFHGKLYCWLLPVDHDFSPNGTPDLCRIDLGVHPALVRIHRLLPNISGRGFFDGGYYYFVCSDRRENWFDWSPAGLTPRSVQTLYRVPLRD